MAEIIRVLKGRYEIRREIKSGGMGAEARVHAVMPAVQAAKEVAGLPSTTDSV